MLIKAKDNHYITATVGSGDNLTPHDIDEGYVGYLNTNLYEMDEYELAERDSGEMLLDRPAEDYTEQEIVYRLLDYWGYVGEHKVIEPLDVPTYDTITIENVNLVDDSSATGGKAFEGETLYCFIKETLNETGKDTISLGEINDQLATCGIERITEDQIIFMKGE